jgi:hypothetical protein
MWIAQKSRRNGNGDTKGEGQPGHRNCYMVETTGENDAAYLLVGGKRLAESPGYGFVARDNSCKIQSVCQER